MIKIILCLLFVFQSFANFEIVERWTPVLQAEYWGWTARENSQRNIFISQQQFALNMRTSGINMRPLDSRFNGLSNFEVGDAHVTQILNLCSSYDQWEKINCLAIETQRFVFVERGQESPGEGEDYTSNCLTAVELFGRAFVELNLPHSNISLVNASFRFNGEDIFHGANKIQIESGGRLFTYIIDAVNLPHLIFPANSLTSRYHETSRELPEL